MTIIPKATAINMVTAFNGTFGGRLDTNDCIKFEEKEILQIFSQQGCVSLRIYFAQDPAKPGGKPTLILVGVDANGNNIVQNNYFVEYGQYESKAIR